MSAVFSPSDDDLLAAALRGDRTALATLMNRSRERLERIVELRMDQALQGRVDPADIVQETFVAALDRFAAYRDKDSPYPFFLWLRLETLQKLVDVHRFHLGTKMRSAYGEVSLHGGAPPVDSASMAGQLIGRASTASGVVMRAELSLMVEKALNDMSVEDREMLALRHFEELTNSETAAVLGISPTAACNRHVRALKRLRSVFQSLPDGLDGLWP
ncbi:sigma-70 family RNA polymerase sigma factor [Roseiconus nitratireducens]|uniref:Sigma-70 family RNA polymerase sigma factor n=1 Tax=Roseiconus nitratireducens TaxID=2605748 RepID=A0A5M6D6C3_9BACT|nr:sigma-70 family RNA polymerase sigma factor [Roseiconus nitratireducens]KAA5541792.1 sigma-70 family RNA polymerase sigma factor [Roseiconus nitratireducens]